jgi:hypothetical protein
LEGAGFARVGAAGRGTASWEATGKTVAELGAAIGSVSAIVAALAPGVLDHLWIYCDE